MPNDCSKSHLPVFMTGPTDPGKLRHIIETVESPRNRLLLFEDTFIKGRINRIHSRSSLGDQEHLLPDVLLDCFGPLRWCVDALFVCLSPDEVVGVLSPDEVVPAIVTKPSGSLLAFSSLVWYR